MDFEEYKWLKEIIECIIDKKLTFEEEQEIQELLKNEWVQLIYRSGKYSNWV